MSHVVALKIENFLLHIGSESGILKNRIYQLLQGGFFVIGRIAGVGYTYFNPYASFFNYKGVRGVGEISASGAVQGASAISGSVRGTAIPTAQPNVPVQPVGAATSVMPVMADTPFDKAELMLRWETDPAAMAVRSRIQYEDTSVMQPGQSVDFPATDTAQLPQVEGVSDTKSAQEVAEESECQTCKERKYQDGSDDPGVSFKTPTHIAPEQAASVVRGHEMEHVVRNQAEADREGRKIVNQSVTYHTAICPECGRVYISGGTTRTTTAAVPDDPSPEAEKNEDTTASKIAFAA